MFLVAGSLLSRRFLMKGQVNLQMAMTCLDAVHHTEILRKKSLDVNTTKEIANFELLAVENCSHVGSVMTKSVTTPWIGMFSYPNSYSIKVFGCLPMCFYIPNQESYH